MNDLKPNQVRLDTFDKRSPEAQLSVLSVVSAVYARQTKYPSMNAVAYLSLLAQKLHIELQPYVFTIYLDMWNK